MTAKRLLIAMSLVALVATAKSPQAPGNALGLWTDESGRAHVEVYKDDQDQYHGKLVWLEEMTYPKGHPDEGKPKTDRNNPDPTLRDRPVIGMDLFYDFVFEDGQWTGGTIYDPEHGKVYDAVMSLPDNDTLHVRGYVFRPAFGKTTVWKRVKPEASAGD